VRWAKIAAIRKAIARGTYDTQDKWEKMLDRLLRDL
jgi:anti-sigma28 factor (negative regulator of flagellin synthesis)